MLAGWLLNEWNINIVDGFAKSLFYVTLITSGSTYKFNCIQDEVGEESTNLLNYSSPLPPLPPANGCHATTTPLCLYVVAEKQSQLLFLLSPPEEIPLDMWIIIIFEAPRSLPVLSCRPTSTVGWAPFPCSKCFFSGWRVLKTTATSRHPSSRVLFLATTPRRPR